MPEIPYFRGATRPGLAIAQPARVSAGQGGNGLRAIGEAAGKAAGYLDAAADSEARIQTAKTRLEVERDYNAWTLGEQSKPDLTGMGGRAREWSKSRWKAAMDGASPRAKHYMEMEALEFEGRAIPAADRVESEYRVARLSSGVGELIDLSAATALTSPGQYPALEARLKYEIKNTPLPYQERMKLEERLADVAVAAAQGEIQANPGGFSVKKWAGRIDAGKLAALQNNAEAEVRSREARARQAAADARAAAAEASNEYLTGASDYLAWVAAGNIPSPEQAAKYSPDVIAALPRKDADELAQKARNAIERGEIIQRLNTAGGPEELAQIVTETREALKSGPENFGAKADRAKVAEEAMVSYMNALEKTPGVVAATSPRVREAIASGDGAAIVAAMTGEQVRLGVPIEKRVALPEDYADRMAGELAALPPKEQAQAMRSLPDTYGTAWPQVFKQIGTKLPDNFAIVATMPDGPAAVMLAGVSSIPKADRNAGLTPQMTGEVTAALNDNETMKLLRSSLRPDLQVNGSATYVQAENAVRDLTYEYVRTGMEPDAAVTKAALSVNANHAFAEFHGTAVRIPREQQPDMVEAGMGRILDAGVGGVDLPPGDIEGASDIYARAIQQNGTWVNDGDNAGVYLWDGYNFVSRNGQPVLFTWEDLRKAGVP